MRILSFHPVATELVFALGAGNALVGRTEACVYPEAALRVPSLGKQGEIGLDTVGILEPDVILLGPGQAYGGAMRTYSIAPSTLADILRIIKELGEMLGKQVEADMIIHDLESVFERTQLKCAKFHIVKVQVDAAPLYLAELVRIAGGEPNSDDDPSSFDPQYIITLGDEERVEVVANARPSLRAVQCERVYAIPEELLRPTPRLVLGIKQLAKILHGVEINGA